MSKPLLIYVAGPYSANGRAQREQNAFRAIDAGIEIFLKGHRPYIPHLTHFVDLRAQAVGIQLTWSDYISWDVPWLELCDALLYLGSSDGADLELDQARRLNKIIFRSVDEIPRLTGKPMSQVSA